MPYYGQLTYRPTQTARGICFTCTDKAYSGPRSTPRLKKTSSVHLGAPWGVLSTSKGMCICTRGDRKIVRPRKLMAQEAPNGPSQRFYGLYTKRRHQTPSVTCPWDAFLSFAQPSAESTNPLCAATIEAEMRSFLSRPAFHPTGGLFELLGCLPEPCICLWLLSQHENVGLVSWGRGGRQ